MNSAVPESIRAIREQGVLEIRWPGSGVARYPFFFLRCECPCAACVNEFTGERTLNPDLVPRDVTPSQIEFAGNYALKIHWSDGHYTGIYSWDHLSRLRQAPEVMIEQS